MTLAIRIHGAEDADAPLVGGYVFEKMLALARETSQPVPDDPKPDVLFHQWVRRQLVVSGLWDDGKIIGCDVLVIGSSMLGSSMQAAQVLGLYVEESHREKGGALMLRRASVAVLKAMGVRHLIDTVRPGTRVHKLALEFGNKYEFLYGIHEV
mgnify:CR=1 FL=1